MTGEPVPGQRRPAGPDGFEPFVAYVRARFEEDPHLWVARRARPLTPATLAEMINAVVDDLGDTLVALGDPTRRRVVELLQDGPQRASDLADAAGTSRQATSRHLKVLRASGLVDVELDDADGRGRVYRLRADRLVALRAWLDQVQAGHAAQLAAYKRHAERDGRAARGGRADRGRRGGRGGRTDS